MRNVRRWGPGLLLLTPSIVAIAIFVYGLIVGTLLMGALLAFLLDKGVKGEGFFRAVYLFPMAVSFIAAGIVWRWLMNPAPADRGTGFNLLFDKLGLDFLA